MLNLFSGLQNYDNDVSYIRNKDGARLKTLRRAASKGNC